MDALVERPVRTNAGIQEALRYIRGITRKIASGDNRYKLDRSDAAQYLWAMPKWKSVICDFFRSLQQQGEEAVYVDICGRANAVSMGADKHYSFSLQPVGHHWLRCKEEIRIQGDIFSARDFYSFVNLLRKNGDRPAWVTFEPVAGLQSHTPCTRGNPPALQLEVTYQRLENNLRKMLEVVRPGGFIFIECPFQMMNCGDWFQKKPVEKYESSLWLKDFCKTHRCTLDMIKTLVGPRYLLRKKKDKKQ
jgi:hypothetical protein